MRGDRSAPIGHVQARPPVGTSSDEGLAAQIAVQVAGAAEAERIAPVIAEAFLHDPTWSWAFPDPSRRLRYWQLCTREALRYRWVLRTAAFETVAIWIPPDGTEFSAQTEAKLPVWLAGLVGSRVDEVVELLRRFGEAHPRHEAHYYLSLLGTADVHRGRGLGMALLRENLARIDAEHMPAYLESSNHRNDHLYESVGFVPVVSFRAPGEGPVVTGMWRARA